MISVWRARFILWVMHALFWLWVCIGLVWTMFAATGNSDLRFLVVFLPTFGCIIFVRQLVGDFAHLYGWDKEEHNE